MLLRLEAGSVRPLHEQVAAAIRRAIAEGRCPQQLPPARDLALAVGVNVNTVLRALRVLRDEGLLEFRRGRGISLASTPRRASVVERVRELVAEAEREGYGRMELIRMIEELP